MATHSAYFAILMAPFFPFIPQVVTPGLLLPPRSPALDDLRLLAAGCRACSTKGHVDRALRARGGKAVDVRAAGVSVRFDLEPTTDDLDAADNRVAMSRRRTRHRQVQSSNTVAGAPFDEKMEDEDARMEPRSSATRRCLQLSIGRCVYQKGKYLRQHLEEDSSTSVRSSMNLPAHLPSFPPPPPPPRPSPLSPPNYRLPPSRLPALSRDSSTEKDIAGTYDEGRLEPALSSGTRASGVSSPKRDQNASPASVFAPGRSPDRPLSRTASSGAGSAQGDQHWGGGIGPRPCKEALTVIQSLRAPLSDPHYFRVFSLSVSLGTLETNDAGAVVVGTSSEVFGGGHEADCGWTGELLVTRCAVLGNPRQPRTRADAMLSPITVEVK